MRAQRFIVGLLLAAGMSFGQQTITDGAFPPANWTEVITGAGTVSNVYTPTQAAVGGNPTSYRDETHVVDRGFNNGASVRYFNFYTQQTLVTTNGITTIDYSYDVINLGMLAVAYGLALRQSGNVYVGPTDTAAIGAAWTPKVRTALANSSFCLAPNASTTDCSSTPNFSAGAPGIEVGFFIANSFVGGSQVANYRSGIDNFSITANSPFAPLTCTTTPTPRTIRSSGLTELAGDVVLTCTGGTPTATGIAIPLVDFTLTYQAPVTTPVIGQSTNPNSNTTVQRSGALLLLDEPAPANQFVCDNIFTGFCGGFGNGTGATTYYGAGVQTANNPNNRNVHAGVVTTNSNTIAFLGIPFDPPGNGTRVLRFTNVRLDVSQLAVGAAINASLNSTPAVNAAVPTVLVANTAVANNLTILRDLNSTSATIIPLPLLQNLGIQKAANLTFTRGFASAWLPRSATPSPDINTVPTPLAQNTVARPTPSETGFYNPAFPTVTNIGTYNTSGLASQGTRLAVKFSNIPANTSIYVDVSNQNGANSARLTASENGAFSPVAATSGLTLAGGQALPNVARLIVTNGSATAVWEVLSIDALTTSGFDFGFYFSTTAIPAGNYPTPQVDFTIVPQDPNSVTSLVPKFSVVTSPRALFNFVNPLVCNAATNPRILRQGGIAELVSDIVLTCTGGGPTGVGSAIPQTTFQLTSNAFITTPVNTGFTAPANNPWAPAGAWAILDEPGANSQFPCLGHLTCLSFGNGTGQGYYGSGTQTATSPNVRNVYPGSYPLSDSTTVQTRARSIVWEGVPVDGIGNGSRVFRFTGVRVSTLNSDSTAIFGTITSTSANIPIVINNGANLILGNISSFVTTSMRTADNSAVLATQGASLPFVPSTTFQKMSTLRFRKLYASAFLPRIAGTVTSLDAPPPVAFSSQGSVGTVFASETGFWNPAFPNNVTTGFGNGGLAGLADQGTRLVARFTNLPPGVLVYVDMYNSGAALNGRAARLTPVETGPFAATPATAGLPQSNVAQITVNSDGTATAVWEVLSGDLLSAVSDFDFGLYVATGSTLGGVIPPNPTIRLSVGPTSSDELPSTVYVPRFAPSPASNTLITFTNPPPVVPTPPPAPALLVSPGQLSFVTTVGAPSAAAQNLSLTSSFAGVSFNFSTSSGGVLPITVTPGNGVVPGSATVSVNTSGLAPGTYKDVVTITAGGTSNGSVPVGITVTVRSAPVITTLDPRSTPAGSGPITLIVIGRGFSPGAFVSFGDASLTPTVTLGGQLNVTVPANLLTQVRIVPVTVTNPDGAISNSADFVVDQFRILSLSPDRRTATALGFNLTVTGNGFLPGANVRFGDVSLSPIGSTSGSMTVNVPAAAISVAGTVQVSVSNPGGQVSNTLPFIVRPVPVIDSVNPSSIPVPTTATTIAVTGRNFFEGVTLNYLGQSLATNFISATQLSGIIPANFPPSFSTTGLTAVTPDGVASAGFVFPASPLTINVPNVNVGDGNVMIIITGSGFGPGTQVQFACPPAAPVTLQTTTGTATSITAVIPGSLLTQPCNARIIVIGPGGPSIIQVPILPAPQISGLSQSTAPAGGVGFTITVNGSGFESGSTIRWGGTPLVTTFVNGSLQGIVPVGLLATPGAVSITVVGPRGSTSNVVSFSVALPALTGVGVTVPATSASNTDQTGTVIFGATFPADLNGSLVMTFRGDGGLPDDPAIQFSNGSRTLAFSVPANTRPTVNFTLKAGTLAGVITMTPQFTSGGAPVAATGLTPVTITVARTAPALTAVSCTRGAGSFNVITDGFTNTRQASQAVFTFAGDNLTTSSLAVDATAPFATFAGGTTTGGTFRYTQTFNVQGNVSAVQTVAVRVTNSVGQSAERSATCQ